jgi:hypothetical protein
LGHSARLQIMSALLTYFCAVVHFRLSLGHILLKTQS